MFGENSDLNGKFYKINTTYNVLDIMLTTDREVERDTETDSERSRSPLLDQGK